MLTGLRVGLRRRRRSLQGTRSTMVADDTTILACRPAGNTEYLGRYGGETSGGDCWSLAVKYLCEMI